ncbi:ATP-binding cassette domain-containing protein [Syntrophomonas sp.]|uniref:ATP-binding cassette domain-containing protein n=1 Tax=Syntrophomonas sp. TaxID=2053627 RepID=UPI003458EC9F
MPVLEILNLTYSYDKQKNVLENLSAQMESGKMYAILGPSGSGKTTLLLLLGGRLLLRNLYWPLPIRTNRGIILKA